MKQLILFVAAFFLPYPTFAQDADNELRNFWMPMAAAAYSDNPNLCLSNIQKHWDTGDTGYLVYRQYTFQCTLLNDTCSGYIAVDTYGNGSNVGNIFMGFRATTNYQKFFETGWAYNKMVPFVSGGKVSKDFLDTFNVIWNKRGMKNDVYTLKNRYPNYDYYIVGHSIGGALAALAAANIVSTGITSSDKIVLFTFGQPRTGDKDFATAFTALLPAVLRAVHNADIVPHLPSLNASKYYHHATEFWYQNDMGLNDTYVECSYTDGEDSSCSDSLDYSTLNYENHKYYYGREFSAYGISGCPDLVAPDTNEKMEQKLVI